MSKENNGGPAFPPVHDPKKHPSGMMLRDYFAAKAMQGLMGVYWDVSAKYKNGSDLVKCQVETAYEYADAMLEARKK